ncbi:amino acid ABC transporter permease [Clostridium felsineum]|uniref:amino acid ABC transporter permease n=1 Tax=Clostridium felsineum TaxID=36839 RepID=UPI00098C8CA2|nr:amino acid ABC transporter permease [Clostridium felsineum]URZ18401.1 L-cystine transport system permease protein TcyL [Clostridium felsineum DSM 794]
MGKLFDANAMFQYFPKILAHLNITLLIVSASIILGAVLGIVLSIFRLYKVPVLNQLSIVYISFVRGTPIIVQMFIVFYGLPLVLNSFNIDINRWDKLYFVIVTYALNSAAFLAEIFRASIGSVPIGQTEAAYSVGLNKIQAFTRIVFPQAIITALPSLGTTLVGLLQDTSIAFTLGIIDVMGEVQAIAANTRRTIEGYVDAAIIFVILATIIEKLFSSVERRLIIRKQS